MTSNVGEALQEAIARARQWAEDDKAHKSMEHTQTNSAHTPKPFQVTTNTNRLTFEQIQRHPDTRRAVINAMVAKGHRESSVVALIGQMRRQGMVEIDDEGILHTCIPEYRPVKNARTLRSLAKKGRLKEVIVDVRRKTTQVVEKRGGRPVSSSSLEPMRPKDPPPGKPLPWSVREILEMLDVLQARAVYDELKKIFGEAK